MDKNKDDNKEIQKVPKLSPEELAEKSILAKRGLRDLGVLPTEQELLKKIRGNYTDIYLIPEWRHECIKLCKEILSTNKNQYLTLYIYGICLCLNGRATASTSDYEEAMNCASKLLNEWRSDFYDLILKLRADSFYGMGNYKDALQDYMQLISLDNPDEPYHQIIANMADSYYHLGDIKNANLYIDEAIRMSENSEYHILKKAEFLDDDEAYNATSEKLKIWDEDNIEYMAKLDSLLILEEALYTNPIKKLEKYFPEKNT